MLRRILLSTCLLLPIVGYASAENPVAGQDYTVLKTPVQTQDPKKIEVLTFFAYTCPHCYTYEKDVLPWSENFRTMSFSVKFLSHGPRRASISQRLITP